MTKSAITPSCHTTAIREQVNTNAVLRMHRVKDNRIAVATSAAARKNHMTCPDHR